MTKTNANAWDDMRRVREEEYFVREEATKLETLKEKIENSESERVEATELLAAMQKGTSPVSGATMFNVTVAGHHVLDCPHEGTLLMTYEALEEILDDLEPEKKALWRALLQATSPLEENE